MNTPIFDRMVAERGGRLPGQLPTSPEPRHASDERTAIPMPQVNARLAIAAGSNGTAA